MKQSWGLKLFFLGAVVLIEGESPGFEGGVTVMVWGLSSAGAAPEAGCVGGSLPGGVTVSLWQRNCVRVCVWGTRMWPPVSRWV